MPTLKVHRLDPRANLPRYHSALAAGLDLEALLPDGATWTLLPRQILVIPTGLAIALDPGWEAQIRPRSGLATRQGVTVANAPGTIDADYRGEVKVALINLGPEPVEITTGMRIAQMVVAPVARVDLIEVEALDETPRGAGGFGSTG
jgi:dUTP pyrophosphatase